MAIRRRLSTPVRKQTGLKVRRMLTSDGVDDVTAIRCIGRYITNIWTLDSEPRSIEAAQIDFNRDELLVMQDNGDLHRFDVSEFT